MSQQIRLLFNRLKTIGKTVILSVTVDTKFLGYCFQMNSNGSLKAAAPGKSGGVSFGLNAQVYDYSAGPASYSEGFSVCFVKNCL